MATPAPSQDGSRRLNCLIEGESIIFLVTVGRDCVVSNLREEVQRERAVGVLKDVDPHTMELRKVSAINKLQCGLLTPQQVNIDLKTHDDHYLSHLKLESLPGADELKSWKSVEEYWSIQPPTTDLHIILRVPPTGE